MPVPDIKIVRSSRGSISMSLSRDGKLVVKAPRLMPTFLVNLFIKQHDDWIQKQFSRLGDIPFGGKKKYQDGEEFLFLGRKHKFAIGKYKEIEVKDDKLLFPDFLLFRAEKELTSWYHKKAEEIITSQLNYYAEKMKTSYSGLTFSDTKSQWGSCSRDNKLQFSWRLIMTPLLVLNYVVIHELAHTMEKNHSRDFWEIVGHYNPTYNIQRKWLRTHGNTLVV